jgi:hypothetical protein
MKVSFQTLKITTIKDYFNLGFVKDDEADYALHILLFGREFSWRFYKENSAWIEIYEDQI